MAALLLDLYPGDEVIMPSYTFTTTATAFVRTGATPVFVDVEPRSMSMDPDCAAAAITGKTKAIVAVHYGGAVSRIDELLDICKRNKIYLIEDAAQAYGSSYNGVSAGSFGDIACFSFHESKNIQCGEGGACIINNTALVHMAETVYEKGTNRREFLRGDAEKYFWISNGSSFAMSEISAAFLYPQLMSVERVSNRRLTLWQQYHYHLSHLAEMKKLEMFEPVDKSGLNGHIFFIKLATEYMRDKVQACLRDHNIMSVIHYVPLHSSPAGQRFGRFHGFDKYTTDGSRRLLRLPMYFEFNQVLRVCQVIDKILEQENLND
jgi:dTDP-4-amino-4,6-dideoxygalactose transaminase